MKRRCNYLPKYFLLLLSITFINAVSYKTAFGQADSVTVSIRPSYNEVSGTHRFLFGENYRKLWATPVKVKVFSLDKEKGSLTIVKQGGGLQTRSLRLRDSSGKEWVLRTLEKYPERKLPPKLKATIAKDILTDQVTTANPFAALTVPPFAEALGIPHANPQVVYVADDPVLGEYRKDYANKVFLFEERDIDGDDVKSVNTTKLQNKLKDDNDASVDQIVVLRARLLDMLVGDWDRHEDQWRWEKTKNKKEKETTYTPIPRDRDQVYYKTSGVFPWIVSHQFLMSKFQGFHENIRDIEGWNINARFFDRMFLTQLNEAQWKEQIAFLQSRITDDLIDSAIHLMPPPIYALVGQSTAAILKARRNNLEKEALDYYRFISKTVDIATSDKHELFDIRHLDSGNVAVNIYKINKHGEKDKLIYERTFTPNVTKEIRLYGRANSDAFSVTGDQKSPIKIRMIGGDDIDSFYVDDNSPNKRKLYIYDRKDQENIIPKNIHAKLRLGKDSSVNAYDSTSFKYNYFGPVFSADYNRDDNIILKVGLLKVTHGFRKEPYASRQEFWANYSTGRNFFRLIYDGDFKKVFGNNDIEVHAYFRGPHYIRNFFGIGNETVFPDTGSRRINYYRNRFDYLTSDAKVRHSLTKYLSFNAGINFQFYSSSAKNNIGNFLDSFNRAYPEQDVFDTKYFAGLETGLVYDSRNNTIMPTTGIHAQLNITDIKGLNAEKNSYMQFNLEASHYVNLNQDSTIVLANRIGLGTMVGNSDFYQLYYLGGATNLRGFRNYRFAGRSMAYHNIELRMKLFDFVSYLFPGTVGLNLFNDVGRVWQPGESSSKWHDGYGGGVYIQPSEQLLIIAQAGHSVEGWLPYIRIGFRF